MFQLFKLGPKELTFVRALSWGQSKTFGVLNSFDITWNAAKAVPLPTISMAPPFVTETCMGNLSLLSNDQVRKASPICLRLLVQFILIPQWLCLAMPGRMMA